jgi:hypothetical protein
MKTTWLFMSTNPNYRRYPTSLGLVVASLLIIGAITLLILGSWRLSDGVNGIVIDHANSYIHFSKQRLHKK